MNGEYLPKELQQLKIGKITLKTLAKQIGKSDSTVRRVAKYLNSNGYKIGEYTFYDKDQVKEIVDFINEKGENLTKFLREDTNMKLYGVPNAMQNEEIQERLKNTMLNNYGAESSFLVKEVRDKAKKTIYERYGVENASSSEIIKEKRKQTCLERYGAEQFFASEYSMVKRMETNIELYGVKNPFQRLDIINKLKTIRENKDIKELELEQEKRERTCLERYGNKIPLKTKEIKQKLLKTNNERYGHNSPMQNEEIRKKAYGKYIYDNLVFDSFPEVAYYIWLSDNNIEFEYQPKCDFCYEYNNEKHTYIPDFKVCDNFVEIKGNQFFEKVNGVFDYSHMICKYDRNLDEKYNAKYQYGLSVEVKFLYKKDYKIYEKYVESKFGKDFKNSIKIKKELTIFDL